MLIENVGGMTELNDLQFKVFSVTPFTISLAGLDGSALNSTAYTTYTSGGTVYLGAITRDEANFYTERNEEGATHLFTGDKLLEWPGGYDTNDEMYFTGTGMFPVQIQAIMPQVTTQDSR